MVIDLAAWGYGDRVRALLDPDTHRGSEPARIVRSAGAGLAHAITASGERVVHSDGTRSRQAGVETWPVTGDWVLVAGDDVVQIASRWSRIARQDPSDPRAEQVLVANVDLVGCVHALDRPLSVARLERLVALAFDGGATPIALLTKADLVADPQRARHEVESAIRGVDVLAVSVRSDPALTALHELVRDRTVALLGPSGAGKSTLVNALVGADVQATQSVRSGDAKGRHTTTARELVMVPGGGVLVDTPGLRAIGLGDAAAGVSTLFGDIDELATRCRFRDCRHEAEPGCAVRDAVRRGELDAARFERYQALTTEIAEAEVRADPVRRRRRDRALGRMYRDAQARRPATPTDEAD